VSKFEDPILVYTDCGHVLVIWPTAFGRDVLLLVKGEFIELTVLVSSLGYVLIHSAVFHWIFVILGLS
jgi:hypothetical protein